MNFPKKNQSAELRKLISFVAKKPDYWFLSCEKEELGNQDFYRVLSEKLKQLSNNVPIEYIMGESFFFGTKYKVTNDVLIPRPETELLVEKALTTIEGNPKRSQKILELGTGSGAVILSILLNLTQNEKHIIATATDLSEAALSVAEENCRNHKKVINFRLGDWWRSLKKTDGPFDVIIANFANPAGLQPIGENFAVETPASGAPAIGNPFGEGFGKLVQGSLEASNINVVQELVDMIETQRAYEVSSKSISAVDEMMRFVSNNL